jgi:hypothetical protein
MDTRYDLDGPALLLSALLFLYAAATLASMIL